MLTTAQILRILAAELEAKHGEEPISVGAHALRAAISLRIDGSVEQKPAQLYTPSVKIPLLTVLALVAERGGVKRERLEELIVEAAVEAHRNGEPLTEWLDVTKAAERRARERIAAKIEPEERRGPLRRIVTLSDVRVDAVRMEPAKPASRRRRT